MILEALSHYIQTQQRVEESALLKKFRLSQHGLAPMIEVLIRTGHVQKTVNRRGDRLIPKVFYSWHNVAVIPTTTIL